MVCEKDILPSVYFQSDLPSSKSQAEKKKGRWCSADSADPGLVTQRLRLGWVKLWSNKWEEIGAGKPRLRLAIYSEILDLCVFELCSLK